MVLFAKRIIFKGFEIVTFSILFYSFMPILKRASKSISFFENEISLKPIRVLFSVSELFPIPKILVEK